jgi:hypothetical protein
VTRQTFHLVLTRFNVRTSITGSTDVNSPTWLEERLRLFERFCVPSMNSQNGQFKWIVMFDSETPESVRSRVAQLQGFETWWLEPEPTVSDVTHRLQAVVPDSATHLLTTRLDNDDGLAKGFVRRLQLASVTHEDAYLNFPLGYQWRAGRLYYSIQLSNPFISYVEPLRQIEGDRSFKSLLTGNHTDFLASGRLRQLWSAPMWLQVLHGSNVINNLRGVRRTAVRPARGFEWVDLDHEGWGMRQQDRAASIRRLGSLAWAARDRVADRVAGHLRR